MEGYSLSPSRGIFFALGHLFEKRIGFFFNLFVISGIVESGYVFMQKLGYIASPKAECG